MRNVLGDYEEIAVLRPTSEFDELNEVGRSVCATFKI